GRRPGVEQDDTGQQLLPGTAGAALLVRLGGRHAVGAQLGGGQHPAADVGEVVQGAGGERGVVGHDRQFPVPRRPPNPCYRSVDEQGQACTKGRVFGCRKALVHSVVTRGYGCDGPKFVTVAAGAPSRHGTGPLASRARHACASAAASRLWPRSPRARSSRASRTRRRSAGGASSCAASQASVAASVSGESWWAGNRPRTTSMPIWIDRSDHTRSIASKYFCAYGASSSRWDGRAK